MLEYFLPSLVLVALITPAIIKLARKKGWVVAPREDRWHKSPTAIYGGVGIYLGFSLAFIFSGPHDFSKWALWLGGTAMFGIGLWDDIYELKPQVKFLYQLLVVAAAVNLGIKLDQEVIPWSWISVPLSVLWLVGITNAVNILDNMDGLSSGTVFVASAAMAAGAYIFGFSHIGHIALMLCGASLGFLIYNFNPAKIFMGDCGSLFLGFMLSGLAVLSTNTTAEASHVLMSLLVPVGALVLPIFDTALVSYQRASHGRSIARGGRDHSSHRLVFLGFSERKAVLLLLSISACGGLVSLLLARYSEPLVAAVMIILLVLPLVFFGIYLGDVKVYDSRERQWIKSPILHGVIMHKKQILQILTDLLLISAAYTGAWLLRFETHLADENTLLLTQLLPWILIIKMAVFWLFGLYKGEWRYVSIHDMVQIFKACVSGSLFFTLLLLLKGDFAAHSKAVLVMDLALCLLLIAGVRSLIRVFREKVSHRRGAPVLILGAGDRGELVLRELRNNPQYPFVPVGFLDDDPAKKGVLIHGIPVLGNHKDIGHMISKHHIKRVFISIPSSQRSDFSEVFRECERAGIKYSMAQPIINLSGEDL